MVNMRQVFFEIGRSLTNFFDCLGVTLVLSTAVGLVPNASVGHRANGRNLNNSFDRASCVYERLAFR